MKKYNERLNQLIDNKGVTPYYLSQMTKVSQATISRLRSDETAKPSISTNKKIADYFNVNADWLLTGDGDMTEANTYNNLLDNAEQALYTVPLLPISAQGGALNEFVASVKDSDCERIISPISGVDFAITVSGDSMAPEYPSGSQILIKRINERAFIDWGKTYVLDTCNGTVIKILYPSENKGKVTCKSINPSYPSFDISLTDIYGIYRVLMCMSVK